VEDSIRITEDRDKWRKYVHGVAIVRIENGERTEQNRVFCRCHDYELRLAIWAQTRWHPAACAVCRSHLSESFVGDICQLSTSLFTDDSDSDDDLVGVCLNSLTYLLNHSSRVSPRNYTGLFTAYELN